MLRKIDRTDSLDGVTFDVIVHRLKNKDPRSGGDWLVRVYAAGQHIHSAEGGVPYDAGLREAQRAMERWVRDNGGGPRTGNPVSAPSPEAGE